MAGLTALGTGPIIRLIGPVPFSCSGLEAFADPGPMPSSRGFFSDMAGGWTALGNLLSTGKLGDDKSGYANKAMQHYTPPSWEGPVVKTCEIVSDVCDVATGGSTGLAKQAGKGLLRQGIKCSVDDAASAGTRGLRRITGPELAQMRKAFDAVKPDLWRKEAARNPSKYTADQLDRMKKGKPPIGSDGHSMEIHHKQPLAECGTNDYENVDFLTRTEHRLGDNYKKNHPGLP